MADHRRLGIAWCCEHTERISGRRAKTILTPIWTLRCVIIEDSLNYYFYYYYYYWIVITFRQGVYNYIPETHHISRAYSVAAVLYLRFVLHVMLFPMLNVLYSCTSTFRSICVQCTVWLFFVIPWLHAFPVYFSCALWIIMTWFQFPQLLLASILFLYSAYGEFTL